MPRLYYYSKLSQSTQLERLLASESPDSSQFTGSLSPSGKLSIGYVPRRKVLRADVSYERDRTHYTCYKKSHWHYLDGLVHEYCYVPSDAPELGLASVPNCHKPPAKRYGLRGIGRKGRDRIREGAYLLERRYGRKLGFYTLTCPYTDVESIYSYNKDIAYIQRSYFQELKRAYERLGQRFSYVSVLEVQPERFERDGIPVLHIHYIAPCYMQGTYTFVLEADTLRDIWGRIVAGCIGTPAFCNASIDASVVKTSAVGYISKYMSKGGENLQFVADTCPEQIPSRWWSMSGKVRDAIKATTVSIGGVLCSYFMHGDGLTSRGIFRLRYYRFIFVFLHERELLVGLSANMSRSDADMLRPPDLFDCIYELL